MNNNKPISGIILLAAGGSSRLGRPKQLLELDGQLLINRMIEISLNSAFSHLVVVLGAYEEEIKKHIENKKVPLAFNPNWEAGMGGSIASGLSKMQSIQSDIDFVLVMLVDQYLVTVDILNKIKEEFEKAGQPILASKYSGKIGVPAIFSTRTFPQLIELQTSNGAAHIVKSFYLEEEKLSFDFPNGQFDIDTEEDYEKARIKTEKS